MAGNSAYNIPDLCMSGSDIKENNENSWLSVIYVVGAKSFSRKLESLLPDTAFSKLTVVFISDSSELDQLIKAGGLKGIVAAELGCDIRDENLQGIPLIQLISEDNTSSFLPDDTLDVWQIDKLTAAQIEISLKLLAPRIRQWLLARWSEKINDLPTGVIDDSISWTSFLSEAGRFLSFSLCAVYQKINDKEFLCTSVSWCPDATGCKKLPPVASFSSYTDVSSYYGLPDEFPAPELFQNDSFLKNCTRFLWLSLGNDYWLLGAGMGEKIPLHDFAISVLNTLAGQIGAKTVSAAEQTLDSRTLLESLGEAIILCDSEDRIIDFNRFLLSLTGYSREELLHQPAFRMLHPGVEKSAGAPVRGSTEVDSYCLPLRTRGGLQLWVRVQATSLFNSAGKFIGTIAAITDITEEVESQQKLMRSESRLRHLFELPLLGIGIFDSALLLTEANTSLLELFDTSWKEIHGVSLFTLFPEDVRKRIEDHVRFFGLETQDAALFECQIKAPSGSLVYTSLSLGCIRDSGGKIDYYVLMVLDISKRVRAERMIVDQKEYLNQVLNTLPHPIFARDLAGRYTLANVAFAEIAGLPVSQILDRTDKELFNLQPLPPSHRHSDRSALRAGAAGITFEGHLSFARADDRHWYRTIKKPLGVAGKFPHEVLGVTIDLTARKQAEDMLRSVVEGTAGSTAGSFFRSLVRHLAEALAVSHAFVAAVDENDSDRMRTLAYWRHGSQMEGISFAIRSTPVEAVLGNTLRQFQRNVQRTFPGDRFLAQNDIHTYIGATLFNSDGKPNGILVVMHSAPVKDWSVARWLMKIFAARAGAELERLQTEAAAAELHAQLVQSQKMDAIGQLAAGVAHDLNNALNAVTGHLELVTETTLDSAVRKRTGLALQGCARAASLINQLLGFSRQGRYNISELDLGSLIAQTISFLEKILATNVTVAFQNPEKSCEVEADAAQLQQVLTNLLLNAQQAMPAGGTITISLESRSVVDATRFNPQASAGEYYSIDITDQGTGIPAANLSRIFEPFFTTKAAGEGSGLGLAMVYGIMQHHGGWVQVHSLENTGTTFSLYFPRRSEEHREPVISATTLLDAPPVFSKRHRLLVIDDEPMLLDIASAFFSRAGLEVETYSNPVEALSFYSLQAANISMVLLDMNMPEMDGVKCFEALQGINPEVDVILLSGYAEDEAVQATLSRGARTFFQKPVEYRKLQQWMYSFLEKES